MNILPLTMFFLFLFAILCTSMLEGPKSFLRERNAFLNHLSSEREMRSEMVKHIYKMECKKIDGASKPPPERSNSSTNPSKPFKWKRDKTMQRLKDLAKLNLFALTKNPSPFLRDRTEALILRLYGEASFFQQSSIQHPEKEIVNHLIEQIKANPDVESLSELAPSNPALHDLFYKMIKGTPAYSVEEHQGYPPLGDFLMIDKKREKAVNFCYSSPTLLTVFFGEEVTHEIYLAEKKLWEEKGEYSPILKDPLAQLVMTKTQGKIKEEDYLSFAKISHETNPKKIFVGKSKDEKIETRN
jgi:hypothetical protein